MVKDVCQNQVKLENGNWINNNIEPQTYSTLNNSVTLKEVLPFANNNNKNNNNNNNKLLFVLIRKEKNDELDVIRKVQANMM